jgi:predicted RND superfamily exporter protein
MFKKLQTAYFLSVLNYPLWVLLSVVLLALGLASQLGNLKIDASSDALTLEYDKDLDYFREVSQRYQSGDFLVVTYKPHGELMNDQTLAHLQRLRDELLAVEGVSSSNSILDVPLLYSPKLSLLDVARGIKTLSDDGVDRDLAKQEFLTSPIYKEMLLGPDGKTTAILLNLAIDEHFINLVRERDALRLQRDTDGLSESEAARLGVVTEEFLAYSTAATARSHERVQRVREVVAKYKDEAQIFLGGVSMITADMVDFISSDISVFGMGIIFFIVVILSIIFRRWQFVVLPLSTCFLAVLIMLGFLAAIDWRLTIISANFVALLLIVSLALTIHLIVRYREAVTFSPDASQREWVRESVSMMAKPCVYTVLTTMVAFVSLVVSGIRPVIDFGWMMTIGLLVAFVLAFLIIPSGLMVLPKAIFTEGEDKSGAFTMIFSRFTERNGKLIIVLGIVAAIVSVVGIQQLKVENRFIDYFRASTEIHQGMLVIDQQLGGTITLDIVLDHVPPTASILPASTSNDPFADNADPFASDLGQSVGDLGGDDPFASDPFGEKKSVKPSRSSDPYKSYWFTKAGLEKVTQLHNYLDGLPEVGKVQSLATAYQVANDLSGRQLSDFELAIMRRALPNDITDFLLKPYLVGELDQTRISIRVKETDPNLRRAELIEKVRSYITKDMGIADNNVHITGVLVLYNNMLQSLFTSQILTIGAVFVGIMVMFLILFRSIALSLIALVPNMLAALVVLGGMGLAGIPLDMMTITIAAIAVGIGVDNAIHYIYRFRREFSIDKNYISAMHRSHGSIGKAMYYTSVTIIVGFSILSLSQFIPSIYFGLLTGLAMFAAIIASLTLLPKLMLMLKPLGKEAD